eukprot:COSAG06_NODE_7123_length_2622_cov_9.088783_2_plen_73_part_00
MQGYDYSSDQGAAPGTMTYQRAIVELVRDGELPQATLDSRAADALRVKGRLGLLDNPYIDETLAAKFPLGVI